MKKTLGLLVLVAMLLGATIAPVAASGPPNPGTGSADFNVMNVEGTGPAKQVIVAYLDQNGVDDDTQNVTLNPYGSAQFTSGTLPVGDGWIGSVVLSSEVEIASVSNIIWTGGQFGDGTTAGAYSGVSTPGPTLYLPYVTRVTDLRFSQITVQNAGTGGDANIQIRYFDKSGVAQGGAIADTIAEGRSKTYDLSSPGGKVPNLPSPFQGAAVVTSTNGKPLAGVVTTHWKTYSTAYEGFSGGSLTQNLPSIFRKRPNGVDWIRHSNILVQNLTTDPAVVQLKFYPTGSATAALTIDDTIPANSSHEYNTRFGNPGLFDPSVFAPLGENFDGSVVVTSNKSIVAVDHTFWTNLDTAATYVGSGGGVQDVFMAWQPRQRTPTAWLRWAKLIVQNLSGSPAAITLTYYNPNGTVKATFNDTIAGNSADGYNTRYGSDGGNITPAQFETLGSDFIGAVKVHSNQPIVAVMNVIASNWSSSYNGYSPAAP